VASGTLVSERRRELRFLATDGLERFAAVGGRFLGQAINPATIELIDI
jgi:hypothetical protein